MYLLSDVLAAFGAAAARLPLALYAATAAAGLAPGLAATTAALTPGLTAALAALASLTTTLAGLTFATGLSAFGHLSTALLIGHRFLLEVFCRSSDVHVGFASSLSLDLASSLSA